jgi:hypothetical protein
VGRSSLSTLECATSHGLCRPGFLLIRLPRGDTAKPPDWISTVAIKNHPATVSHVSELAALSPKVKWPRPKRIGAEEMPMPRGGNLRARTWYPKRGFCPMSVISWASDGGACLHERAAASGSTWVRQSNPAPHSEHLCSHSPPIFCARQPCRLAATQAAVRPPSYSTRSNLALHLSHSKTNIPFCRRIMIALHLHRYRFRLTIFFMQATTRPTTQR